MSDKVRVRFVGSAPAALLSSTPDHSSIQFQRYGQLVELDAKVYQGIISGEFGIRLAIIPDDEFAALGHPPSELAKFGAFETHEGATREFKERRDAAGAVMSRNHEAASLPMVPTAVMPEDESGSS